VGKNFKSELAFMVNILPEVPKNPSTLKGIVGGLASTLPAAADVYKLRRATRPEATERDILRAPKSESWKQLALQQKNKSLENELAKEQFFKSLPTQGKPLTEEQISQGTALDPKRMSAIIKARGPEQAAYLARESANLKKAESAVEDMARREQNISDLEEMKTILHSPGFKPAAFFGVTDLIQKVTGIPAETLAAKLTTENAVFDKYVARLMSPELKKLVQAGGARLFRPEIDTVLKSLPNVRNSVEANERLIQSLIDIDRKANIANQVYADMLETGEITGSKKFTLDFQKRLREAVASSPTASEESGRAPGAYQLSPEEIEEAKALGL
jgi:hypothetical protein